ncbi:GlyGly-CTERM sorting domain-containing protein [Psychromonas hadalis]|uniref:GlyGly-CTERM sorting domain-containing protein n=1 Tax=Psychromonas hadalis TaxID=211669 RepID=UPI0003B79B73|nr:GlyGly-CTERM sorting domain-containing protein [Psychromonas hadalis]
MNNKNTLKHILLCASLFSPQLLAQPLQGQYMGQFSLTMNTHKDDGIAGNAWPEAALNAEYNGIKYKKLGQTITDGLWLWDFDKQQVVVGGSTLFALDLLYVPFQLYNLNELENKRLESFPEIASIDEISIPFTYNAQTQIYTINYAHKMHVIPPIKVEGIADYPIGEATANFHITITNNNEIKISSADIENNGAGPDNVPGTKIPNIFPAVVQAQYESAKLYRDNGIDSNNNGISDLASYFLNLNKKIVDTDGDGINDIDEIGVYLRPTDSDRDGVADVYEFAQAKDDNTILSGFNLQYGETVTIKSNDALALTLARSHQVDLSLAEAAILEGEEPSLTNEQGVQLNNTLGALSFLVNQVNTLDTLNFDLTFKQLPPDLKIYRKQYQFSFTTFKNTLTYQPVNWVVDSNDINTIHIDFAKAAPMGSVADQVELILLNSKDYYKISKPGTDKPVTDKPITDKPVTDKPITDKPVTDKPITEKPVIEDTTTVEEPTTSNTSDSKSGGSMNWFFVSLLGLFALGRKKLATDKASR